MAKNPDRPLLGASASFHSLGIHLRASDDPVASSSAQTCRSGRTSAGAPDLPFVAPRQRARLSTSMSKRFFCANWLRSRCFRPTTMYSASRPNIPPLPPADACTTFHAGPVQNSFGISAKSAWTSDSNSSTTETECSAGRICSSKVLSEVPAVIPSACCLADIAAEALYLHFSDTVPKLWICSLDARRAHTPPPNKEASVDATVVCQGRDGCPASSGIRDDTHRSSRRTLFQRYPFLS